MKKDLTEIAVIRDRSGSMMEIKDDMEGGLWSLITEQHGLPGTCRISLYDFDDVWQIVFEAKPSGEIKREDCLLVPRGNTALYDSVVKSLASLEARILAEREEERPEFVFVVVITDGKNNASRENTLADSNTATKRAQDKYGWQFNYLAAGPDAFEGGKGIVAGLRGEPKILGFVPTSVGTRQAYGAYSKGVSDVRRRGSADVKLRHDTKDEK